MKNISFGDVSQKAELGDVVSLQGQNDLEVVKCQETGVLMLNIDADQLQKGDLTFIKKLGLTISNPDTDKPVALGVDYKPDSWGHRIHQFFTTTSTKEDDDDDDSNFFGGGGFLGGMGSGGFGGFGGGGFGGFGGGSFSGGGASGGF